MVVARRLLVIIMIKNERISGKFSKEQVDEVKLIPSEYLNVLISAEQKDYYK